jgi:hypothetical protein
LTEELTSFPLPGDGGGDEPELDDVDTLSPSEPTGIGKASDVESSAKVASSARLPVVKRMMIKQTACVSKDDAMK